MTQVSPQIASARFCSRSKKRGGGRPRGLSPAQTKRTCPETGCRGKRVPCNPFRRAFFGDARSVAGNPTANPRATPGPGDSLTEIAATFPGERRPRSARPTGRGAGSQPRQSGQRASADPPRGGPRLASPLSSRRRVRAQSPGDRKTRRSAGTHFLRPDPPRPQASRQPQEPARQSPEAVRPREFTRQPQPERGAQGKFKHP